MSDPIDPRDPANHGVPLWAVHGSGILRVKLLAYSAGYALLPKGMRGARVCVWGHSVYRGVPGYRTLGIEVREWAERTGIEPLFFRDEESARAVLEKGKP